MQDQFEFAVLDASGIEVTGCTILRRFADEQRLDVIMAFIEHMLKGARAKGCDLNSGEWSIECRGMVKA